MNQKKLAKLIGVSSATVSRVINEDKSVSEKTKQKVKDGIRKYGYIQNTIARDLRTSSTQTIGLLAPDISNEYFTRLLAGIESLCYEKNYDIIVQNTNENEEKEIIALRSLLSHRVAGLIAILVDANTPYIERFNDMGIPVVLIDRRSEGPLKNDIVCVDNFGGMKRAVSYLAKLGHKDIACIYGNLELLPCIQRLEGFKQGMRDSGLSIQKEYLIEGELTVKGGYDAAFQLISLNKKPSAIITSTNFITIGAYQVLCDNKIAIPDDISLIGFDDFTLASYLTPSITVVHRPMEETGKVAAEMLFERIKGDKYEDTKPREIIQPTKLVTRKSCQQYYDK